MTDDTPTDPERRHGEQRDEQLPHAAEDYKVLGETAVVDGTGVLGHNTATSGRSYGVEGVTDSSRFNAAGVRARAGNGGRGVDAWADSGIAVAGWSEQASGGSFTTSNGTTALYADNMSTSPALNHGLQADTNSSGNESAGAFGRALATSGKTYGVFGQTLSSGLSAAGVRGETTQGSGVTYGVVGRTDSADTSAAGVRGEASDGASGLKAFTTDGDPADTYALDVYAEAGNGALIESAGSTGLEAVGSTPDVPAASVENRATSGLSHGVDGRTDSVDGGSAGLRGEATTGSGNVFGVDGVTQSPRGAGVRGRAPNDAAIAARADGVRGETGATGQLASGGERVYAAGVQGTATATSGTATAGVAGRNQDTEGIGHGVVGTTDSTNPDAAGVYGSAPNGGIGVYADAGSDGEAIRAADEVHVGDRMDVETSISNQLAADLNNYPLVVHNTSADSQGNLVLALKTGTTGDPQTGHNFVQFLSPDGSGGTDFNGTIQGDGSGGVTYKTSGADYAEYLPKANPDEELAAGDVVGVFGNAVTRETDGAARVLVVSNAPNVAGNAPEHGAEDDYRTVAFTGQVPVKVRGPVADGDLVVPSGEDDGTGRAIEPAAWRPGTPIVGQAWESDDDPGVSEVVVAVGVDDPAVVGEALAAQADDREARIEALERENERLRAENESLRERLDALESQVAKTAAGPSTAADD